MNAIAKKSFYHTSMLIQMAGKPHNCTSFKGHFLENGLKPAVCHHVNQIFWKIVHDFSIGDTSIGPGRAQTLILFYSILLEIPSKLRRETIHLLPLSGSSVKSGMKQTALTDSPKFCIMLARVPGGLFLSCLSRKFLKVGGKKS
jgi:hypothetical protein